MSRLTQGAGGTDTDQSKLGINNTFTKTKDKDGKDTSVVIEQQLSKINANLNSFTLEQF